MFSTSQLPTGFCYPAARLIFCGVSAERANTSTSLSICAARLEKGALHIACEAGAHISVHRSALQSALPCAARPLARRLLRIAVPSLAPRALPPASRPRCAAHLIDASLPCLRLADAVSHPWAADASQLWPRRHHPAPPATDVSRPSQDTVVNHSHILAAGLTRARAPTAGINNSASTL
jgi:hypothetical protein